MPLESATYISGLVSTNPSATDTVNQADDHLRMLKATLLATFPSITGAITKTHSQINDLLEKSGGTMTGALVLSGAPTVDLHPATKLYVDSNSVVPSRTISAGTGLTGGGDLSANRTLSINTGGVGTTQLADNAVTTTKITDANVTPAKLSQKITRETQQATTSGTEKDFSIPSWVKRIHVLFNGVSLSGSDHILIQIGDSGGIETTSYTSTSTWTAAAGASGSTSSTSGFILVVNNPANAMTGEITLSNIDGNTWIASGVIMSDSDSSYGFQTVGKKTLSDVLTQVRVTKTGSNTFDNGAVNIIYE